MKFPLNNLFVDVGHDDRHEFRIASFGSGDNFPFKINNGRFEDKLRLNTLTDNGWAILDLGFASFNQHRNLYFVFSCIFGIKLNIELILFFWLQEKSVSSILVLIFFHQFLLIVFAIIQVIFIDFHIHQVLPFLQEHLVVWLRLYSWCDCVKLLILIQKSDVYIFNIFGIVAFYSVWSQVNYEWHFNFCVVGQSEVRATCNSLNNQDTHVDFFFGKHQLGRNHLD